ncbi:MAG: restriction endonuclease subunit S [Alphaproteobacteria bacterium]|nr:restriction endonuclease subunit S [Alphaproteobacteria bacterium]
MPPRHIQDQTVSAIETHYSRLDAAVASLTRAKANVKRARASVLKAAVEGRLVPTEAALARAEGRDYEPAAVRVARVEQPPRPNRYKTRSTDVVPGHAALSVGDTQAALPEGWTRAPMVEVARMESGHTPSRSHPEWWDGDVPWIGIADAREHHGGVIHDTEQHTNADGLANSAARLLPAGTVCISRTASVGYVVVMGRPMATSQDFVDWICTDALDPHWVRVVFLADRDALLRFGKGSVHKTIYFPELLSLHIAIPPLAEQHRIVAEVDRRLSVLDALDATLDANLARCDRLRQAVLKHAFEGRLVPAEADAPLLAAEPQMPLFAQDARS